MDSRRAHEFSFLTDKFLVMEVTGSSEKLGIQRDEGAKS